MPQAPQLLPACSTFSSLLIVLNHNTKKRLHYTLNTLHQTLYNTSALSGPVRTGTEYWHVSILASDVPGLFMAYRDFS